MVAVIVAVFFILHLMTHSIQRIERKCKKTRWSLRRNASGSVQLHDNFNKYELVKNIDRGHSAIIYFCLYRSSFPEAVSSWCLFNALVVFENAALDVQLATMLLPSRLVCGLHPPLLKLLQQPNIWPLLNRRPQAWGYTETQIHEVMIVVLCTM